MKFAQKIVVALFLVVLLAIGVYGLQSEYGGRGEPFIATGSDAGDASDIGSEGENAGNSDAPSGESAATPAPNPIRHIKIAAVGDLLMHMPQVVSMPTGADGRGDLSEYFRHIKADIEAADIAICNFETTFGGEPYTGFPMFSSPDDLAYSARVAGFDVGLTANNHQMDTGTAGMIRTAQVVREAGLEQTGTRVDVSEKNYLILEVGGEAQTPGQTTAENAQSEYDLPDTRAGSIKIGIIAYTYGTGWYGNQRTLNGLVIPDDAEPLLNSYVPDEEADKDRIRGAIAAARADGADIVIQYFHFGNEYQRWPDDAQRAWAQVAIDAGADLILASHVHVVQPLETVFSSDGTRAVPVYWGLGNFISNQRAESLSEDLGQAARYTEQGLLALVDIAYDISRDTVAEIYADYVPLWVDKYWSQDSGRFVYTVVALTPEDALAENPDLAASGHIDRARQALTDMTELVGPAVRVE